MIKFISKILFTLVIIGALMTASVFASQNGPLLDKLVEKGVITNEEAASISEENKDMDKLVRSLSGFKIGLLWYLSYQNGQTGNSDGSEEKYNQFAVKRGYLTVSKDFMPWFSSRMTLDITSVKDDVEVDGESNSLDGSLSARMKYLYAQFNLPDIAFFTKPTVEMGLAHMPWLDFEEHVNWYRCQDTMFLERNGIFNSADTGITFASLLGGKVSQNYQDKVNSKYPGRYGSMSVGVYNGSGYHAAEKNMNKALEGRLTIRPLPDIIPGIQLSYFGITGKGNTDESPDWRVNLGLISFEHEYIVLAGQYYNGKGNQKGGDENDKDGYSCFTEIKPSEKFSIIGRYDHFDPDTDVSDNENDRYIAGIAYHIDKQHKNMVLIDYDTVNYKAGGKPDDKRAQATLQISY